MADDPPQQLTAPRENAWVRFCRWLWKHRGFIWGTVVLGVVLNLFASWLSTPAGSTFSNTPLGAIFGHPLLSALIGLGLLALTAGLWLINRLYPAPVSQHAPARPITQHDRDAFVHLLRKEYSKRLTQSLQGMAIMALGLHERTDITGSSAQFVFRRTDIAPESPFPPGTSLTQVYDYAGQGLLLLGAPGAGKTTLLLDLARELLARAESGSAQPLPVILNLSSWASKKLPLATWLIDQLRLVYGLPPYLGQGLLDQDRLTLLLDGFDEVEAFARSRCIETINAFRGEHFVRLVVCSRSQEYLTQEARLQLSSAVEVQPLQEREVMDYLKRIGKPLAAVRAALRTNPVLKQLLTTPLMLSVVILAYRDTAVKDLPTLGSIEEQQRQIFARYVERMLEQRASKRMFTSQQTCQWLTWLAQNMEQQHLTEFYLEHLQQMEERPLASEPLSFLLIALLSMVVAGLDCGLFGWYINGGGMGIFLGLIGGVSLGGCMLLLLLVIERQPSEAFSWSWSNFFRGLFRVVSIILPFTVFFAPIPMILESFAGPQAGLPKAPVDSLLFGLLLGLYAELLFGLPVGLIFGVFRGLKGSQIPEHERIKPNQGIRISGWTALWVSILTVLSSVLLSLFVGTGADKFLIASSSSDIIGSVLTGLFVGLIGGLLLGLYFGGATYLQHYVLRYLLWSRGAMPWHYVRFLDEATERILLQKVGGGYRFIHPLFQEYFPTRYATR